MLYLTKYPKHRLEPIVNNSKSYSDVARALGLAPVGGNLGHIRRLIIKYNLDISHFTGKAHNKGKSSGKKKTSTQLLIVSSKSQAGWRLRRALIESGRPNQCEDCSTPPMWNNKPLTLTADHVNGNRLDHRPENLKLLCPNCHSQTSTFAGRNKKS